MNDNLQIPQEVRNFLEGLLDDANMSLTGSMREKMINDLYVRLDNYITGIIIDTLPAEHLDTFLKMNEEKKSQAEIERFLNEKMPNYKELFANAFAKFRELYLGNIDVARAKSLKN